MIYLYAIGDREAPARAGRGLAGLRVETLREHGLTAFVSSGLDAPVEPSEDTLREHARIVAALARSGTVLPLRFGTQLAGEEELRSVLAERHDELERSLDRVRGRVELGVRALWTAPAPESDAPGGTAFMRAKLDRRGVARHAVDKIHVRLAEHADDSVCRLLPDASTAFASAYLVAWPCVDELEREAQLLGHEARDVELVVSGPWPPYSFSEARA